MRTGITFLAIAFGCGASGVAIPIAFGYPVRNGGLTPALSSIVLAGRMEGVAR